MRSLLVSLIVSATVVQSASAEQIWLTMDQVKPYLAKQEVDQIVVGNPGIADVTVRDRNHLLFFGKAPGLTNIYLFDANGEELDNLIVRVRSPNSEMLTLHRGAQRMTLNCMTVCEQTITVGDNQDAFSGVTGQVQQKFEQARSAAVPSE